MPPFGVDLAPLLLFSINVYDDRISIQVENRGFRRSWCLSSPLAVLEVPAPLQHVSVQHQLRTVLRLPLLKALRYLTSAF
jgi:hypothetical protein